MGVGDALAIWPPMSALGLQYIIKTVSIIICIVPTDLRLRHIGKTDPQCGTVQFCFHSGRITCSARTGLRAVTTPLLQCRYAAASAFRQPSPTCRTAFPAQHLRPSGVLSYWPDGLELTPGFYPGSNEQHRLF